MGGWLGRGDNEAASFTASTRLWSCLLLNYCAGALIGNVQSRRLLINAVSGFWQHKQTVTQSSILLHKG